MSLQNVANQIVPRAGQSVWLLGLASAAMAFLAVFALALSVSAGRVADNWSRALAQTATLRISAPADQIAEQTAIVMEVLLTTPGIESARLMDATEQAALLEAWLGPDLPLDALPLPRLIEVTETPDGPDRQGLRLRLSAEAPGAVYDDHTRWRRPLLAAAAHLRMLSHVSLGLIGAVFAAIVVLAASASLASNAQVIRVLRLVGARDRFIARAFVRSMTLRATIGAGFGMLAGLGALMLLPDPEGSVLAGFGFDGASWAMPLGLPILAGGMAWAAALATAFRVLRRVT